MIKNNKYVVKSTYIIILRQILVTDLEYDN